MAQPEVKQFRYYNSTSDKNVPALSTYQDEPTKNPWINNLLEGYDSVIKLGILTLPGTKFWLNNNITGTGIIVDHTGVYELDLRNIATIINGLTFDATSLAIIDAVDNASIIVDILYNNVEGTVS